MPPPGEPRNDTLTGVAPEREQPGEHQRRDREQQPVEQADGHRTGTASVTLYWSNNDTRAVIVTAQVPAGERTASGTV